MGQSEASTPDLKPAPEGYPIKLVRDQTPRVLNSSGDPGELFYGRLPDGHRGQEIERSRWLRLKLVEEVGEYLVDGGIAELCDALAVIEALAHEHGRTLEWMVEQVRRHPRGGFRQAVMMYGRHPEFDGDEEATHHA